MSRSIGILEACAGQRHTKRMAAVLEVVKKRLAHADSAPFVLFSHQRHGGGVDEGSQKRACAGKQAALDVERASPHRRAEEQRGRRLFREQQATPGAGVTQRGGYPWWWQHSPNQRGLRVRGSEGRWIDATMQQARALLEASRNCAELPWPRL